MAPIIGEVKYIHKSFIAPETKAGEIDLIGFIDAPEISPKNKTSRPIIPPIASPENLFNRLLCTIHRITAINKIVAMISME